MENEIAQKFEKWCQMFFPLTGRMRLPEVLIRKSVLMNYCKLSGHWIRTRDKMIEEKAYIDSLMKEGARTNRVSSALPKLPRKRGCFRNNSEVF